MYLPAYELIKSMAEAVHQASRLDMSQEMDFLPICLCCQKNFAQPLKLSCRVNIVHQEEPHVQQENLLLVQFE